ncbi:ankyrin repeat domain-containing protein [Silanimonas sp.]|uniref:ankyrin repeat domain-containing protein n=1 Tax=Silanimonas sp. TaxID=1929290 RepID=UPI0022C970A5|nr:ankyrin repeat domain-containing protein [Silanimonas sp.]MCZ8164533.1 ankyrin repeat domain-containing protein [Silanimonas sp.]
MTDPRSTLQRSLALPLLLIGLGLAVLPALWPVGAMAVLGPWLAQPALALGMALLSPAPEAPALRVWWRDAITLAVLWGATLALLGLGFAWPWSSLLETGSLAAALGLGAVVGLAWTVLWRQWTLFAMAARQGGGLAALAAAVPGTWSLHRGLALAVAVLAATVGAWLLVWPPPRLLSIWWLAAPYAAGLLAVHAALQRSGHAPEAPPLPPEPVAPRVLEAEDDDEPASPAVGDVYAHARAGRIDAVIEALDAGADPDALPEPGAPDQRSLPMLAALLPDLRLLRELIIRGADLNQEHAGLTPLLAATRDSWHGRIDAVTMLLANGADPRRADRDGNTPLHHAARSTDPAIAAQLLDAAADLHALNGEAQPPLALALASGNWRVARFLLERGAKPESPGAQPSLLAAAGGDDDDPAGVQLLLKHKAKVDSRDARGRTALLEALAAGHAAIAQVLIDAGASVDAADDEGRTALLEAARSPNPALLPLVLARHPDPAARDVGGRNALALACEAGVEPERLRALLALGIDREARDAAGRRPVDHAVGGGRWALVAVLDPDYPLPGDLDEVAPGAALKPARERLRDALRARDFRAAQDVLGAEDAPGRVAISMLLLEFADAAGIDVFEWLLEHGAHSDDRVSGMDSVGLLLLDRGLDAELGLRALLAQGQTPQGVGAVARWLAANPREPSRAAAIALHLLERGADPFGPAPNGDSTLGLAAQLPCLPVLDALLQRGVDPAQRDARGHTPLHLAVARGHEAVIKRLVRHGAPADARAADGQTPHGAALARGRRDLAEWLDWGPWKLPGRALQPGDLPAAAMAGDLGAVVRLVALGLAVDGVDAQGCTALLRAAGGGHLAIVDHLLGLHAHTAVAARTGATPLSAAISMRHANVVDRLLAAGADPEQAMPGGVTPLMLASALGLPDLVSRLLRAGADVAARDAQGLTPLHCAALFAFNSRERARVLALFDALLLADADAEATSASEQTPTLLLLGARAEAGASVDEDVLLAALDRLLSEGVSLGQIEHRGLTVLHLAALHGLGRIVERLLREGANPAARDRLGRTPHDLALIRGFVDIAALFQSVRNAEAKPAADAGTGDAAAASSSPSAPASAPASSGVLPSLARLLKPRDP